MTPPRSWWCTRRSRSCWPDSAQLTTSPSPPRSPAAARPSSKPLVGMFVNTLVLRTQTFSGETFTEFLHAVRGVDLDAFGHSGPFESVVEALDPVRSEAFRRSHRCCCRSIRRPLPPAPTSRWAAWNSARSGCR